MSYWIIISIVILIFVALLYLLWVRPLRIRNIYAKAIRAKGYSVIEMPFNPFTNERITTIRKGIAQGDALKRYKQLYKDFDVVISNFLMFPKLELNHPDFIKDFYNVDKHYDYPKQIKLTNIFSRLAGHGLPFSQGASWKRKRNTLNKIFNFDFVRSQSFKISKISESSIKEIQSESLKKQGQNFVTYNILDLTVRIFSNIMMEIFLGGTENQLINGEPAGKFIKKLMGDLTQQSFYPFNFIMGTKFLQFGITKSQRQIKQRIKIYRKWGIQFVRKRIEQINIQLKNRKQKKQPHDIIQALIMTKQSVQNKPEDIIDTESQIFQQFTAFFIAGTDTTSNFAQMMIYQIGRNKQIESKVREEIQKYMKNDDYSYENLKNLKYIDYLQKQTTRFYGPGTHLFSRNCRADNYLNGIQVRKGTCVSIGIMANYYSQKYFKNPLEFNPQRWETLNEQNSNISPFIFGGFSAGARSCIGKHLALLQSKIALVKFMKRYKKIKLGIQNFKMTFKFTYCPQQFNTTMEIQQ